MKTTGMIRKIDDVGRILLPKEMRRLLKINDGDPLEFIRDNDKIVLLKYQKHNTCIVTGKVSSQNMTLSGGIVLSLEGAKILLQDLLAERLKDEISRRC